MQILRMVCTITNLKPYTINPKTLHPTTLKSEIPTYAILNPSLLAAKVRLKSQDHPNPEPETSYRGPE